MQLLELFTILWVNWSTYKRVITWTGLAWLTSMCYASMWFQLDIQLTGYLFATLSLASHHFGSLLTAVFWYLLYAWPVVLGCMIKSYWIKFESVCIIKFPACFWLTRLPSCEPQVGFLETRLACLPCNQHFEKTCDLFRMPASQANQLLVHVIAP